MVKIAFKTREKMFYQYSLTYSASLEVCATNTIRTE